MTRLPRLLQPLVVLIVLAATGRVLAAGATLDHRHTDPRTLPIAAVEKAKQELHVAYAHTSHGSQVTDGMKSMNTFINAGGLGMSVPVDTFRWTETPTPGALDLDDYFVSGDLGNPDRTSWADRTRTYLDGASHADVNVVMWSWCGQADTSAENIDLYLNLMNDLEEDYPNVTFVYMTGHVNGCSTTDNLFLRNQQIRDFCAAHGKVLYDFADIESWDPDGNYYGDKRVLDDCSYDSDGNGSRDRNWALDWQAGHVEGVDWYSCSCAHSQSLNGNRKAYAAWALWVKIAALRNPEPGDADRDGIIGAADAAVLAAHWLTADGATWDDGDFTGDGDVDDLDLAVLAANWSSAPAASVPEPSAAPLLIGLLGTGGLFGRRRLAAAVFGRGVHQR
ncbi:MAG: hypothetical protein JW809_18865 [Pirellulales bacterium]|nr:hypothetical protein [Pirellulales bacterium]